jgi:hypothetical protein
MQMNQSKLNQLSGKYKKVDIQVAPETLEDEVMRQWTLLKAEKGIKVTPDAKYAIIAKMPEFIPTPSFIRRKRIDAWLKSKGIE